MEWRLCWCCSSGGDISIQSKFSAGERKTVPCVSIMKRVKRKLVLPVWRLKVRRSVNTSSVRLFYIRIYILYYIVVSVCLSRRLCTVPDDGDPSWRPIYNYCIARLFRHNVPFVLVLRETRARVFFSSSSSSSSSSHANNAARTTASASRWSARLPSNACVNVYISSM